MRVRTLLLWLALPLALPLAAPAADAQALKPRLEQLFTFGTCGQPLCLDLDNFHGDHYIPSAASGNLTVIGFVTQAVANATANLPISATSSGATFSIVDGLPVRTSTSAGPVFAERPQTLGRRRFFLGTNVSGIQFTTLNGAPLDNLQLNFAHENVLDPRAGDPLFENDIIRTQLGMKLNLVAASLFATYGLTDFIDIGVAVPLVRVNFSGVNIAQIDPFGENPQHYFGGTSADPVLRATSAVEGTAAGLGDVVGRVKINLGQGRRYGAAILTEVRFPTGDENNLLGAGSTSIRALGIVGAQYGTFSVHANTGYIARTSELQNDAVLFTAGFDQLVNERTTVAFSLLSEAAVGDSPFTLPSPIDLEYPFVRSIQATSIPERSPDRMDASLGVKFSVRGGTVLVLNGTAPLKKAGLQPDYIWNAGVEISF
jgi:hypothetical protein